MNKKLISLSVGVALLTLTGAPASASVTEYTSASDFAAAASPSNYNFEGIAPSGSYTYGDTTVGGVTFSAGGAGAGYVLDGSLANYGASFFSGQSLNPGTDLSQVICTLSGAAAFGLTYGAYADSGIPFTVTLSTGDSFTLTTPVNAGTDTGFVGFVSDTPITSVTVSDAGSTIDVVNFETATSVPEPGTLVLLATGLVSVALSKRRRTLLTRVLRRAAVRG